MITEGEFKSLKACLEGFYCIGLGGVFNFMRADSFLPELASANWAGRNVYICFDSDAATNPDIQAAEGRLIEQLSKRQATVYLSRILPRGDGEKVGLDDLIVSRGAAAFEQTLLASHRCGELESSIAKLNEHVAIVTGEGKIYEFETRKWVDRGDFTAMSKWAALKVRVARKPGAGAGRGKRGATSQFTEIQLASEWLTHEHARRYDEALFRPEYDALSIPGETGGTALNLWRGWEDVQYGDVSIFKEFYEYLFSSLADDTRDFVWNLLAYKTQNPGEKLPFAIVLIGEAQGVGKTTFGDIMRDMAAPYGRQMTSKQLINDFRGWLESSLIVVINEADPLNMQRGAEELKTLVTEKRQSMNEKYRREREVSSYCTFIVTANNHAVGCFPPGDRRFFVVQMPRAPLPQEFYRRLHDWRERGGAKSLLGHFLNYDLKGWRPPAKAPNTPEKAFAMREGLTAVGALARTIMSGTEHAIVTWLDGARGWAEAQLVANANDRAANDTLAALSAWRIRPFYTPDELLLLFPDVRANLALDRRNPQTLPGALSQQLRNHGVPYLNNKERDDGCFMFCGRLQQFLVVAGHEEWAAGLTQADFDRVVQNAPPYASAAAARLRGL